MSVELNVKLWLKSRRPNQELLAVRSGLSCTQRTTERGLKFYRVKTPLENKCYAGTLLSVLPADVTAS